MTEPRDVTALAASMGGRWLVTTQGSQHIWDLDAGTYRRLPGPSSKSFAHDRHTHRITHIEQYPQVGSRSLVWFDDPTDPGLEHWRISSTIQSITRLDPGDSPAAPS